MNRPAGTGSGEGELLIAGEDALERTIQSLSAEALVAVDTEAASFHRYRDRVCLIQLSSRSATRVVDPLALGSLEAFGVLLANPAVEKVFHDADYDLRLLDRVYGFRARSLFDTRVAAQLLNEPGVGLAALLEKYFGLRLDKRFQRADWSARPLTAEMLEYAAADTTYLPELRDILRERLIALSRLAWAQEEFLLLEQVRWSVGEDSEPGYLRLKGAKALKGRPLAVLRELYEWRERTAERLDRAAFRVMNNDALLAVARALPGDAAALAAIPGVGRDASRARDVMAAVQRALGLSEADLPRVERPPRRAADPAYEARLERLKLSRNAIAARLELAPGVACPNGTLEAVARANPGSLEELALVPGLRRWQLEEFGSELLQAAATP